MPGTVLVGALVGVVLAIMFNRLSAMQRRLNRLSRLDAKLDALLKNAGVTFDELEGVPADVRKAIERGETVLAIQRLRHATGVGLEEAKGMVDDIRRRRPPRVEPAAHVIHGLTRSAMWRRPDLPASRTPRAGGTPRSPCARSGHRACATSRRLRVPRWR